jgi:hypothetical protein
MVNYYRDMWPHRLHILAPLIAKTSAPQKGEKPPPFQCTPEMQKAFDQMKELMAADVICAYPNHNKPFHIYSDASNYQLDACIMQDDIPVAHYSKKLNSAQMNYAIIDKEVLCAIVTLRKFCSRLLGAVLHVCTDQKILKLHYVEGPCNVIADAFASLLHSYVSSLLVGKKAANANSDSESNSRNESSHSLLMDDKSSHSLLMDDRDIVDCLMNLPCLPSRKKG